MSDNLSVQRPARSAPRTRRRVAGRPQPKRGDLDHPEGHFTASGCSGHFRDELHGRRGRFRLESALWLWTGRRLIENTPPSLLRLVTVEPQATNTPSRSSRASSIGRRACPCSPGLPSRWGSPGRSTARLAGRLPRRTPPCSSASPSPGSARRNPRGQSRGRRGVRSAGRGRPGATWAGRLGHGRRADGRPKRG